ncbi:MAG: T9SS type A sorting domain-containing protein [Ignavibacteria bacterium]|nr:T9SS type A sorting domain-containing protein [Ignavibacteria bacterium]
MKTWKISFLTVMLILFVIGVSSSSGQLPPKYFWKQLQSPVTSNLKGMSLYYIVGENGTFLRKQSNYVYTIIPGIPNYTLNSVSALNETNQITVVGDNGVIYYAQNYQTTWSQQTSGTTFNLNSVATVFTRTPTATRITVGDGGTILKSVFTGSPLNWTQWSQVTSGSAQNLNCIAFDTNVALIAGNNGTILRSTDKGNNWSVINPGVTNNLNFVYMDRYYFQKCWITGDNGLILKSTNAGLNWIQVPSGTTANLKSFSPFFVCGSNGTALRSLDSGLSWIPTQTYTNVNLNASGFSEYYNSNSCIIAGNSGTILRWDIDSSYILRKLEENSISSYFIKSGIFNSGTIILNNSPGFQWPKGSNKFAIYSSGLSMSAMVQGQIRQSMASYYGEMLPGYCNDGIPYTNDTFKFYSVKRSDNPNTNPDWLYWGLMVPYGAPYVDVNNNGNYEPMIDTPGVKNASQTIFICMTDAFTSSHTDMEGFGGGTLPLYNEVHLTAWCYSQPSYADMQFLKFEIINKGNAPWMRTYFTFYVDPDLGDAYDDYIGCDTVRKLGYCYNGDNDDPVYGLSPPAVGIILLKGAYRKYVNPGQLGMTAFTSHYWHEPPVICECRAYFPLGAYYYMMGYKIDSTCWLDPTQSPKKKTKFIYPGDPETSTGWTEYKGSVQNCDNDTLGQILSSNPAGDRRFTLSSGSDDLTVMPGDTQRIVMCQLIARGNSNLNSVTKLKQLADVATEFYNTNFTIGIKQVSTKVPQSYSLGQNYPNPFNSITNVKFSIPLSRGVGGRNVSIKVFDLLGREIKTLVNEKLKPGTYEVRFDAKDLPSGIYFYRMEADRFIETKKLVLVK